MKHHPKQLTLGEFIDRLEKVENQRSENLPITFDFVNMTPTTFDSYRGDYSELALGYIGEAGFDGMRIPALLKAANAAIGETFVGWKGGNYIMGKDTPLWVANPGECGSTAIVGIKDLGYMAIIKTKYIDS